MPTSHNPLGTVLPAGRRDEVLRLTGGVQVPVVEDLTQADIWYGERPPPPPLGAGDDAHVIVIGSTSKVLWGGLRIGWLRARGQLLSRLSAAKAAHDFATSIPSQVLAAELLHGVDEAGWPGAGPTSTGDERPSAPCCAGPCRRGGGASPTAASASGSTSATSMPSASSRWPPATAWPWCPARSPGPRRRAPPPAPRLHAARTDAGHRRRAPRAGVGRRRHGRHRHAVRAHPGLKRQPPAQCAGALSARSKSAARSRRELRPSGS